MSEQTKREMGENWEQWNSAERAKSPKQEQARAASPELGCDFTGQDFGAPYPDSCCVDGYLWDLDSAEASGSPMLTSGGDIPCPQCNRQEAIERKAEDIFASTEKIRRRDGSKAGRRHCRCLRAAHD